MAPSARVASPTARHLATSIAAWLSNADQACADTPDAERVVVDLRVFSEITLEHDRELRHACADWMVRVLLPTALDLYGGGIGAAEFRALPKIDAASGTLAARIMLNDFLGWRACRTYSPWRLSASGAETSTATDAPDDNVPNPRLASHILRIAQCALLACLSLRQTDITSASHVAAGFNAFLCCEGLSQSPAAVDERNAPSAAAHTLLAELAADVHPTLLTQEDHASSARMPHAHRRLSDVPNSLRDD